MGFISGTGQQKPAQFLFDLMVHQLRSPFFGHDDQVDDRQLRTMAAKKFPEQALYPVPLHRFPQALGHDHAQPGTFCGRGRQSHAKMARV
jgi:hypothetical protein